MVTPGYTLFALLLQLELSFCVSSALQVLSNEAYGEGRGNGSARQRIPTSGGRHGVHPLSLYALRRAKRGET